MSERPLWIQKLQYRLDLLFSSGAIGLILLLGLLSILVITIAAALISLFGIHQPGTVPPDFFEAFWEALLRTLDPGTMGGDMGQAFRLVMFMVTIGGIFIISSLIGVLSAGLEKKLQELSRGHSRVVERDHIVILGWSRRALTIVSELVQANANQKRTCIVILAEENKVAIDECIHAVVGRPRRTRILCRSGSPLEMANLELVSVGTSRSILVLTPGDEALDTEVIKTVLALRKLSGRRGEPFHVVAELHDPDSAEVGNLIGGAEVEWVEGATLASRVIAQSCRQSGLPAVYNDLLDYANSEIHCKEFPVLAGKTYGEALLWFEKSALLGIVPAAGPVSGEGPLNPPMDRVINMGDQLILLAEDDKSIEIASKSGMPDQAAFMDGNPVARSPEKTLLLGWNRLGPMVVMELDHYVAPGSLVEVVAQPQDFSRDYFNLATSLENQKITFREGDTTSRPTLEALDVFSFDHIVVLCYAHRLSPQRADADTLVTLIHLRDMAEKAGKSLQIVSEMLDDRNCELAKAAQADDFIVSDRLISLAMAQVAQNKAFNLILGDLCDSAGSEVYLKPIGDYVQTGCDVTFCTVVASARERNETAFGYRLNASAHDPACNHGVVLNPPKSQPVPFVPSDRIIVMAKH